MAIACKMALDIVEWYSEAQVRRNKYDIRGFRTCRKEGVLYYYKMLIDYPHYRGVCVRRTEPELMANTKVECDKIYPQFGGKWDVQGRKYKFPSGAEIFLRPCHKEEHLGYFQGPNFHRLWIGELTQFPENWVDKIEFCCRSPKNDVIEARHVYDTNPGGIGHNYVKRKYIDKCRPVKDGAPIYIKKFDIYYQKMKPNKIYKTRTGETYLFIPALIFENSHVEDSYIQKLLNKNEILKQMWLYGNWDAFLGQFFDMWDQEMHVISEKEFFNATDNVDLIIKKRDFDWSDYRLYRSFDYGYKAPWACGAYAVHNRTNDIVKFAEIVKTNLTALEQARLTKKFFLEHYGLRNDDFEMNLADPKSFWKRADTGDEFIMPVKFYRDEGIILMGWDSSPGSRVQGAMITAEALRIREDGTPRLTFLSNCEYNIETIPNLPSDKNHLDDVDTKAEDHAFDELKGFLMMIIGQVTQKTKKKKGWRDKVFGDRIDGIQSISWKVA
ncbi:MAG: hypothetical protein H8D22_12915 [Candidatus Cloacimonetes bacterium]|nr:hypothetical protein [Candidatus Cloacimonadota bacterium]